MKPNKNCNDLEMRNSVSSLKYISFDLFNKDEQKLNIL